MTIHRHLALPLAFALLGLTACSGGETRKASFIQKGETFMAERNYAKARLEFRNALQIDPDDTRVQTLAAVAAEEAGDFREAAGFYRSALKDPANLEARAGLAKLFIFSGAPDEARKLADDGLITRPGDPTLIAIRAATKMIHGDKAGARADAEAAVKAAPDNEDAVALMASIHAQEGDRAVAIRLIEEACRRNSTSVELLVILAQLYATDERKADAEEQLQRVVELDPSNLGHRYRLAQFQAVSGQVDRAEATLREIVRRAPEDVDAKLELANLIASQRSFAAGEKSLRGLLRGDEGNLQLQMGLGRFYETHNRRKEAEGVYRAVIAADGTGPQALAARNRLAILALEENRIEEARVLLEEVLQASSRDNDALIMRARLAQTRGDGPAAIADLRAVLRDQPNSQPLMRALAQAYLVNGEDALAEESFRSAIQANPRDIRTRLALAKMLIDSNRPDEAQPVVDQLVADQPGDVSSLEAAFRVQVARRDFAAARRTAASIQTVRPDAASGFYLTGLVEQAVGNADAARASLEKAVTLAPDALDSLAALVRVDISQKEEARALGRIDAAIARQPRSPSFRHLKAEALSVMKRWPEAIVASDEASQLAPKWYASYRTRAQAELASGKVDAAIATYRRGIEASAGAPALVIDLATLQERLGRWQQAIAEYEAWLKRDPRSDVAANNLAMMLITHRKADTAARDRALALAQRFQNSANPAFLDTYAWVRYTRGEFNEAVPPLQRAVDLAPKELGLRARLGLAQKGAGQDEAAQRNLESALTPGGRFAGVEEARAALEELKRGS